jgi:DNA-binding winged helix-turn-helix (wHTH) protein
VSLVLAVQTERIDGIDAIREKLGDSGNIRGSVTPILRRGARVGAESARVHAPRGSTKRLSEAIADDVGAHLDEMVERMLD